MLGQELRLAGLTGLNPRTACAEQAPPVTTTPALHPQRPGREVLTAHWPCPGNAGLSRPAPCLSRAPLRPAEGCSEAGVPSCQHGHVLHKPLSLPRAGCDLRGPSELRPTLRSAETLPPVFKGAQTARDAALFAISAQQTGWLPPFKGRLSPGITADAAGIPGRQRPAPGPPRLAGAFKGSEAFISCRQWARPPLPAHP